MSFIVRASSSIKTIAFLLVITLCLVGYTFVAQAASTVPLAIVRFNQPEIYYEQQLARAVQAAIRTKPTVVFDVISFVPQANESSADQPTIDKASAAQSQHVISTLKQLGLKPNQYTYSKQSTPQIRYHEVQIFVR